jgi:hypothetical protein
MKAGEIVGKLWRWAAVGVSAIALAAGAVVAAMPAGTHAKPATQVAQSQLHIVTAACTTKRNYLGGHATFTYCTGNIARTGCSVGNNGALSGPTYAANGCSTQLFLWLTHTTSGTPDLCVNPETSTNTLKKYYEEYKVAGGSGHCGT